MQSMRDHGTTLMQNHATSSRDLLVLWQHPETRAITVIGRLQYDGQTYSFGYTRGAAQIEGFRPLPGLRDLRSKYESDSLFPLFAQRVMDPSRPDYETYLSRLGLSPTDDTPWEQILRSSGRRAGDTLQFLAVPQFRGGEVEATFLAHGVRHIPNKSLQLGSTHTRISGAQHEGALAAISPGDRLCLVAERNNPVSDSATLLTTEGGMPLGYVPQVLAPGVKELMGTSRSLIVKALRVNGPEAPSHLRLVVHLQATVLNHSVFGNNGEWDLIEK